MTLTLKNHTPSHIPSFAFMFWKYAFAYEKSLKKYSETLDKRGSIFVHLHYDKTNY